MSNADMRSKLHALLERAIQEAGNQLVRYPIEADQLRAAVGAVRDLTEAICLLDGRVAVVASDARHAALRT